MKKTSDSDECEKRKPNNSGSELKQKAVVGDEYTSGLLYRTEIGRWSIGFGRDYELTSGEYCEVFVAGQWIATRIEHNGKDYYAVVSGIQLYEGMRARRSRC